MKSAFLPFDERFALISDVIKPAYAALREEAERVKIHYVPTVLLLGSAVLILLVGVGLLLKGRGRTAYRRELPRAARSPTTATVVALEAKDLSLGAEPDTRYFPRVSFVPEGATDAVEAQTLTDVPSPPPRVGEQIEVAYDPERPDRVDVAATEGDRRGRRPHLVRARRPRPPGRPGSRGRLAGAGPRRLDLLMPSAGGVDLLDRAVRRPRAARWSACCCAARCPRSSCCSCSAW